MAKLSIPRLALAMTISGIFLFPPTDSLAAKKIWLERQLEKLFSGPQDTAPKRRKPRPAKKVAAPPVVTPLTAPVPEAKPDNEPPVDGEELPQSSDVIPAPKDNPQAAAPVTKPADPEQDPPVPQSKPAVPPDSVRDDAGATLPESVDAVPVPEPNPRAAPEDKEPSQRPAGPVQGLPMPPAAEASPQDETPPETVPIPEPNPRKATEEPDGAEPKAAEPAEPPPPPDPRSALRPDPSGKLPLEEIACRQRLTELGVRFDNHPAEADPAGCSVPYPLSVKSLGKDIGLQPHAEMNCATAEAAARFAKDFISPAAKQVFGQPLKSVTHASAYVCRPRNGSRKLSEHAFGNALDIASFTLSGGTSIAVQPNPDAKAAGFLGKVRRAACGPFKTVLGPGSDADHAEHFHLDLAPRRNGGTFCQ
jgi:hypothetical protein